MKKDHKWMLEENMLVKEFEFKSFLSAMGFVNRVAEISEDIHHHPNILIHDYNKVRISISTHETDSVTDLDYKLADLIDHIIEQLY